MIQRKINIKIPLIYNMINMTGEIKNGTRAELQNYNFLGNFFIYTDVLYFFNWNLEERKFLIKFIQIEIRYAEKKGIEKKEKKRAARDNGRREFKVHQHTFCVKCVP